MRVIQGEVVELCLFYSLTERFAALIGAHYRRDENIEILTHIVSIRHGQSSHAVVKYI